MYVIISEGKNYYCDELKHIKKFEGNWYQVAKENGEALFYDGRIYSLPDKDPIPGKPVAIVQQVDGGVALSRLLNRLESVVSKLEETNDALCELSEVYNVIDDIEEALCDLSMEVK